MSEHRYEFIGNEKGNLRRNVSALIARTDEPTTGVIVDCTSTAPFEAAAMRQVLDSGRTLALYKPRSVVLDAVRAVAGHAPAGEPHMVRLKKEGGTILVDTDVAIIGQYVGRSDEEGVGPVATPIYTFYDPDSSLLQTLTSPMAPRTAALSISQMSAPPTFTYWGTQQLVAASQPIVWPWPGWPTGYADDNQFAYGFGCQTFVFNLTAYVYWCNGPAAAPYFTVILRFYGNQSASSPLTVNTANTYGYANGQLEITVHPMVDGGGKAGATTCTLVAEGNGDLNDNELAISANLDVWATPPSGSGCNEISDASVGVTDPISLSDWTVVDNTNSSGLDFVWVQTNPFTSSWANFENWLHWGDDNAFENQGDPPQNPLKPSALGTSSVPYEAFAVYKVAMPTDYPYKQGDPPPAAGQCIVSLPWVNYQVLGYLIHDDNACNGCYNDDADQSADCVWYSAAGYGQTTPNFNVQPLSLTIDLGAAVAGSTTGCPKPVES